MTKNNNSLSVKDHSVSGELFELKSNERGDILITTPQPSEKDIGRYYQSENYISHTDSRRTLFDKVYQWVKNYSIKRKLGLVEKFRIENSVLLDIGCGTGDFLTAAKMDGWEIFGVEPNPHAREIAIGKSGESIMKTINEVRSKDQKVQVITLWHVLEHLHRLEDQIELMKEILNPSGRLVVAVPNFKSYDAEYYKEHWAAYDVPRHLWHFSKKGIENIFESKGMILEEVHPMKFDSYYVSLLSEKYKRGWMNFIMAFLVGLKSNLKAKRTGEYSSLIYVLKKAEKAK